MNTIRGVPVDLRMKRRQLANAGHASASGMDWLGFRASRGGRGEPGRLSLRALSLVRSRLRLGALLMFGFSLGNCALWLLFHPILREPSTLLEVVSLLAMGLVLDAVILREAQERHLDEEGMAGLGLLYHVLRSLSVVLYSVRLEVLAGWQPSPVTFASVTIAVFPLLVPTTPQKLLGVSLLAGSATPLVLWLHGVPPELLVRSVFFSIVSVALAVFCGQVAHGLSAAVSRSDELGAYRLIAPLSRGRTGALWRAEHRLLTRPSAVKIIRTPWFLRGRSTGHLARFQREAQVASRLTSPHTVTVYDYGIADDGSLYYARELLEGETLEQWVGRAGPASPLAAVRVALQVCDSLGEAHERGLLHRRLSPRQIFVCRIGRRSDFIKVLDFGLVDLQQQIESRTFAAGSEQVETSVDCLAPEVLRGQEADEKTDLYQLGCVLFFLLTGEWKVPTVVGSQSDLKLLFEHERLRVAPLRLKQAVMRCLAITPTERFGSVDELTKVLWQISSELEPEQDQQHAKPLKQGATSPLEAPRQRDADCSAEQASGNGPSQGWSLRAEPGVPAGSVMSVARHRLERFGTLMGVVTVTMLLPSAWLLSDARAGVMQLAMLFASLLLLDLALVLTARDPAVNGTAVMRIGLGYFIVRVILMTFLSVHIARAMGTAPPAMSFALVLLVILPFLIVLRPLQVLLATGGAALGHPVALLVSGQVGAGLAATGLLNAMTAVGGAYACSRLLYRVQAAASKVSFGSYRLTELLARGAMGEVWRAEHELLARPAALKLISAGERTRLPARLLKERFAREARVTARLTSPHTVTLFDYGVSEDNTYYYVMELLEGRDLQKLVDNEGPLPWQDVLVIALQVCDSLGEAHRLGLVHRDLKPGNLFLAKVGRDTRFVKVLDFGLSELEWQLQADTDARVAGTPGYLPPEALLEQKVDARSDLYQLGCVLFFLLSGRLVFDRSSVPALAVAHVRDTPLPVSQVSSRQIPGALEQIVARCLAKSPDERFSSAEELESALRGLLPLLGTGAHPVWRGDVWRGDLPIRAVSGPP